MTNTCTSSGRHGHPESTHTSPDSPPTTRASTSPAGAGIDEIPGGPQPRGFLALYVLAWFGMGLATGTIGGGAIQKALAFLDEAHKGQDFSVTAAIGGITVVIVTPLAGRLSDRTMSRFGVRRPWILGGALIGWCGVVILATAGNLWGIVAGWVIVQIGFGSANAAIHALLADQIPTRIRARVSAAASASSVLASIVGVSLLAVLPNDAQWSWFMIPGTFGALFCVLVVARLKDIVRTERARPWSWSDVLSTYWLNPVRHPDFFWAWMCRLLVTMGMVAVSGYLFFFIVDHLGIAKEHASSVQAQCLVIFTVCNVVMTLLGGAFSDRTGRRKPIVLAACIITCLGLLVAVLVPGLKPFMIAIGIIGAGQGAYVSVDVALMTEVLPSYEEAGKDLGIVALSYQLPQLLLPIVAMALLSIGGGSENYLALYIGALVLVLLGGLCVIPVRGVR